MSLNLSFRVIGAPVVNSFRRRLRRFFGRRGPAVKAGVVTAVGAGLAVTLVVTMPNVAQAATNPIVDPQTVQAIEEIFSTPAGEEAAAGVLTLGGEDILVAGGTAAVAGGVAAADGGLEVLLGAAALGGLGAALYALRDTKFPWDIAPSGTPGTSNTFGSGPDQLQIAGNEHQGEWGISSVAQVSGSPAYASYTYSGSGTDLWIVAYKAWCQAPGSSPHQVDGFDMFQGGSGVSNASRTIAACSTGNRESITGIELNTPNCSDYAEMPYNCNTYDKWGPTPPLPVTWGDLSGGTGGFDPKAGTTTYTTTVTCIKPDNTEFTLTDSWTGTSDAIVPSCAQASPGSHAVEIKIVGTKPDGSTQVLLDTTPKTTPSQPICDPTKGTASPCKYTILIDGKPCTVGDPQCANWSTINQTDPSRVQCYFGPYLVDTSECDYLERAYEPLPVWATGPNIDGDPSTKSDSATNSAGQPEPSNPSSDPNANGQSTGTSTASGAQANPQINAQARTDCWPNGWGVFNPLAWIYQGGMCIGRDLFEPSQDAVQNAQNSVNQFSTKAPISWVTSAAGVVTAGQNLSSDGCPNWTITVGGQTWNVVCGNSFTQAILDNRVTILEGMTVMMFWPLIRGLWYAMIPILTVNPKE